MSCYFNQNDTFTSLSRFLYRGSASLILSVGTPISSYPVEFPNSGFSRQKDISVLPTQVSIYGAFYLCAEVDRSLAMDRFRRLIRSASTPARVDLRFKCLACGKLPVGRALDRLYEPIDW
ncbi:hypothetical protein BofuT4_P072770.1 [Botrytis cinerea T4]|uniref:Uncharacterized protein n=1 Tax=Botryotinia fuckeliana (strain T4) TaxID=999810 RepID=G2XPQ4_BOTF4|nr:hypothetical protein BofuT4_P072770.1 [Botrytis cinerea T4]